MVVLDNHLYDQFEDIHILLHKCFIMTLFLIFVPIGVCPLLQDPMNGQVFIQGNMAIFACSNGATVMGNSVLKCSNGNWNSSPPTCKFLST